MLAKFTFLCAITFVVGYLLTWILYQMRHKKFKGSAIQTKIHTWIPIFFVVVLLYVANVWLSIVLLATIGLGVMYDYALRRHAIPRPWPGRVHLFLLLLGMALLVTTSLQDSVLFLAIWYLALLSDVTAYFFGNFIGKHPLPTRFNRRKSWEGVLGQIVGAGLGFVCFSTIAPLPLWLPLTVGVGAALGDLSNSYLKRMGGFKDWSNIIPGHGGFIDRLCSLSYATLLSVAVVLR